MRFRRLFPLSLTLVVLLAAPAPASANELTNGSVEDGLRTWSPMSAGLSVRAGGVHGSKYARAMRRSGTTFGLYSTVGGLEAGQSVSARASVRAPRGKQVCIRIRERTTGGNLVAGATRCVRSRDAWQRPTAVGYTVRRAGTRLVVAVYEHRTHSRNWLDIDWVVLNAAPLTTPPAGTVITTNRSWSCTGRLSAFGELPIKVVSNMPNPGDSDAIRLIGCYGDGDPATVDLILDVRGNGSDRGTAFDAVRIGQNARDLVVTGNVECGARHTNPNIHQDIVQALSGNRIEFRDFTSGDPETGRWTCWGAGGGWFIAWANGNIPTDLICLRCKLATYNQNMRLHESVRSGARDSVFGYSRSYGIFIGPEAVDPVNVNNRVIRY